MKKAMNLIVLGLLLARVSMFTHLDGCGSIMASGKQVYPGAIAVSPDLAKRYGLTLGMGIELDNLGTFTIETFTSKEIRNTFDVYIWDRKLARTWGAPCLQWRRVW